MTSGFNVLGSKTMLLRQIASADKGNTSAARKKIKRQQQRADPQKIITISAANIQIKLLEEYIQTCDPHLIYQRTGLGLGNLPPHVKDIIRADPEWQEAVRNIFDYAVKKYQSPDRIMPNNRGLNNGMRSPDSWYRQASIVSNRIALEQRFTMTGLRLPPR